MIDRIGLLILALLASSIAADDTTLPSSVPPFALGDFSIATVFDRDGASTIEIEMFELRSRNVQIGDDVPVIIDGRVANGDPFLRDTFSPTRRRAIASSLDGFSFWDLKGKKLKSDDLAGRLTTRTKAVIVRRDLTDGDMQFLRYFADDVLFILLSRTVEVVQVSRR
jgi:hypothetical protein